MTESTVHYLTHKNTRQDKGNKGSDLEETKKNHRSKLNPQKESRLTITMNQKEQETPSL